ncbi:MAG: hypothetical protein ACRDHP_18915, partial [Ktedonobacterales bacterium]
RDLRSTIGNFPNTLVATFHRPVADVPLDSRAALEAVRGQLFALAAMVSAVAVGGMRLRLGLAANLDETLVASAVALAYAWMLWAPVGAALAAHHRSARPSLVRPSTQAVR